MAYQVLARKYRPQQFSEIVGQDHIVRTLENAIKLNRIAHAYLFVGPRGTGKTTTARIFAKALNCSESKTPTLTPCDKCSNCQEIAAGTSIDVLEIDGASNNGVEQVRELREVVRYSPASARFKIIYIDEVHMLSVAAFNALLKTLEEPPAHVKFLFATTDPQKIPLTILSRCQRFDLHRIPQDLIIKHLKKIAGLEKVNISDKAVLAIARGASGGMRDAESALDQLIAFCGDKIEEADVLSIFGLAAQDQIMQLTRDIIQGNRSEIVAAASSLTEEGKDLNRVLSDLVNQFRGVLLLQAGAEPGEMASDELADLKTLQDGLPRARTLRILEILTEAEPQMRYALSRKILFEITLLKAIETREEVLIEDLIRDLKQLQSGGGGGGGGSGPGTGSYTSHPSSSPSSARSSQASAGGTTGSIKEASPSPRSPSLSATPVPKAAAPSVTTAAVGQKKSPTFEGGVNSEQIWKQLLQATEQSMPMLKASLMEGRPVSMTTESLIIGFDPEFKFQKEFVDTPKARELVQNKLREITQKRLQIKVVFENDPSIPVGDEPVTAAVPAKPQGPSIEEEMKSFEDDPLIRKALEIFKGHIIEVRK